MDARKVELHHHEPEQVKGYIRDAEALLSEMGLDPGHDSPLFLKVIDLISSKTVQYQVPQPVMLGGALPGVPRM